VTATDKNDSQAPRLGYCKNKLTVVKQCGQEHTQTHDSPALLFVGFKFT
jgi:hypothetical protein